MGSSDRTNRDEPRAPREAAPIPLEQLDLDQRAALLSMQRAFANILADVGPLVEVKVEPARCRLPGARPERDRASRLMLIDGGRGSGKTSLLLTLLDAWAGVRDAERAVPEHHTLKQSLLTAEPEDDQRSRWFDREVAKRVWALPILDFDPMPKGLPLVAWVLQALRAVVEALGDDPGAARTLGERGRSEQRGLSLRETWHRLHDDAVLAWEDSSDGTGFQARAEQDRQRLRSWAGFEERFTKAMDALFNTIKQQAGRLDAHFDLLVLPIDDVDMQVSRSPELLHALRLLRHDRLVFLCTGDKALLEQTAQAKADGELARLAGGGPSKGGPVGELGAKVVQKMFHPAHTWHRPTFGLRDVLRNLVKVEENKPYRWAKWAAELESIVAEVVSPATVRLWRMNYRDLNELAAELSRREPRPVSEEPSAARTFQAIQEVDHLFAQLLIHLPDNHDRAQQLLNEPGELREELIANTFGPKRFVDQRATLEHTIFDPDAGTLLRRGIEFRRHLPVLDEANQSTGELLLAWSHLISLAAPEAWFIRSSPLAEVGMASNTPPPVRGVSNVPGVAADTWVYWPISAALRAYLGTEQRFGLFNNVLALVTVGLRPGRTSEQSRAGSESYHLTCLWLFAHYAAGSEVGEALLQAAVKERELPEDARRFEDLIGRAEPVRHIARALVHPMFGLGSAVRAELMMASFGTSRGVSELSHLQDDMQPSGPVTKLVRDAATLSGADAEGDLEKLSIAAQGAEPWWRMKLWAHWGPGAWAAHRLCRYTQGFIGEDISPYYIQGESEWLLGRMFRGNTNGFYRSSPASSPVFCPGPELGLLALQAMGTASEADWDRLLWTPTGPVTAARWIVEAWERSALSEGRPDWQRLVNASSDGQSLSYSGPPVELAWEDEDGHGLRYRWVARTVEPDALPSLPASSPLPGLLGIIMDLTRGAGAQGAPPPIRIAKQLISGGPDLLRRIGCPSIPTYLRAERLRTWRPEVMTGWEDRPGFWSTDEVQVLAAARWLGMLWFALNKDETAMPTAAPGLDASVAVRLSGAADYLALTAQSSAGQRAYGVWLRGAYSHLKPHASPGLLARWQEVIDQHPWPPPGPAGQVE